MPCSAGARRIRARRHFREGAAQTHPPGRACVGDQAVPGAATATSLDIERADLQQRVQQLASKPARTTGEGRESAPDPIRSALPHPGSHGSSVFSDPGQPVKPGSVGNPGRSLQCLQCPHSLQILGSAGMRSMLSGGTTKNRIKPTAPTGVGGLAARAIGAALVRAVDGSHHPARVRGRYPSLEEFDVVVQSSQPVSPRTGTATRAVLRSQRCSDWHIAKKNPEGAANLAIEFSCSSTDSNAPSLERTNVF